MITDTESRKDYIDIHSHFLPFLDDGAEGNDHCIESARCYYEAGFSTVIATPHFIHGTKWTPTPEKILESIQQTGSLLEQQNIPMTILPGMEIMITEQLCTNFEKDRFLALNKKGYYLVEFPLYSTSGILVEKGVDFLLSANESHFVIAHPERCRIFNENSNILQTLVDKGLLTQMNIDSLLGTAGKEIQRKAFEFIQTGLVHFLASDTHAKEKRMPPDSKTMEHLRALLGEETTQQALLRNPQGLLTGGKVDPLGTDDGNLNFLIESYGSQGGCIQKIKKFFTIN